jgi:hypothetical protein
VIKRTDAAHVGDLTSVTVGETIHPFCRRNVLAFSGAGAVATAALPAPSLATPRRKTSSGTPHVTDSTSFKVSNTIAAALETIKSGRVREMHWRLNAYE